LILVRKRGSSTCVRKQKTYRGLAIGTRGAGHRKSELTMREIEPALDTAFVAYLEALATGADVNVALEVGLARYRAFFPDTSRTAFEQEVKTRFASSRRTA
jgi:hypothetical protein